MKPANIILDLKYGTVAYLREMARRDGYRAPIRMYHSAFEIFNVFCRYEDRNRLDIYIIDWFSGNVVHRIHGQGMTTITGEAV